MIGYFRVSTQRQGDSGLGIEAQEGAVNAHVTQYGCKLLKTYTECETGKKHDLDNRPALKQAIAHARRSNAILVVGKLDRLLRSTVVRSMLKTGGVKFVACDNPHANELTIDILAAVAEDEVRRISVRTREALAAYKRRGGLLGAARPECRENLSEEARLKGIQSAAGSNRRLKLSAYEDLLPTIRKMQSRGLSLRQIASELTDDGQTTRRGKPWNAMQVKRVLKLEKL